MLHFDVSHYGRYLVWQPGDRRYDSLAPKSDILLRDREAGGEQLIGHGFLGHSPPAIHEPFIEVPPHEQVLLLPSLTSLELPGPLRSALETNDGRWLVKAGSPGPWLLVDLATGNKTLLTERSDSGWPTAEFLDLFHDDGDVSEPWRYYYDGRPPEQLARRTGVYIPLADGRIAMVVDYDNHWFSDLVLVERATLDERRIAPCVSGMATSARWPDVFEPDVIAYAVSDGARSGLWIARLAPE